MYKHALYLDAKILLSRVSVLFFYSIYRIFIWWRKEVLFRRPRPQDGATFRHQQASDSSHEKETNCHTRNGCSIYNMTQSRLTLLEKSGYSERPVEAVHVSSLCIVYSLNVGLNSQTLWFLHNYSYPLTLLGFDRCICSTSIYKLLLYISRNSFYLVGNLVKIAYSNISLIWCIYDSYWIQIV